MISLKSRARTLGVASLIATAAACSSNKSTDTPTTPTATVSSIAVAGTAPNVGLTAQLTATATMSNGTTQNVTSQATWQSSNNAVVTVTPSGAVTALGLGTVTVQATYQNVGGADQITIAQ